MLACNDGHERSLVLDETGGQRFCLHTGDSQRVSVAWPKIAIRELHVTYIDVGQPMCELSLSSLSRTY